jgi:hypothetical protein
MVAVWCVVAPVPLAELANDQSIVPGLLHPTGLAA